MTATLPSERTTGSEPAERERIRAFRAGGNVLIAAEGDLPTPGFDVDLRQSPQDVFPPQYDLLRRARPGVWSDALHPYRHAEVVRYPPVRADGSRSGRGGTGAPRTKARSSTGGRPRIHPD